MTEAELREHQRHLQEEERLRNEVRRKEEQLRTLTVGPQVRTAHAAYLCGYCSLHYAPCWPLALLQTTVSILQAVEAKQHHDQLLTQLTRARRTHTKLQKELEAAEVRSLCSVDNLV
jgi:hypothetical protein